MKSFKVSFAVCIQNLRKWKGDYRILLVFMFLLIVNHYHASWFLDLESGIKGNPGVAPWMFVFAFTDSGFGKIMMLLPVILLFSNAPFVDNNQPFLLARCTRRSWCFGQLLYIMIGSAVYVLSSAACSFLMLIGRMEFTSDWGTVISSAASGDSVTGAAKDVVYYFSPASAMFYTMLFLWFTCIFIGLVMYVINAASGNMMYGICAGGVLVIWDFLQAAMRSSGNGLDWLSYLSPVTWSSINQIDITGKQATPDFNFVLCGYILLITGLVILALVISRKQEIKVIQSE